MPHLKELYSKHQADGLELIGIHSTRGGETMAAFAKEHGINFPIAIDVGGATVKAYGGNSYPDYFVIDRKGNLRYADLANTELPKAVALLLAEEAE